mmetsp:Transcript_87944/g.244032  ORF Transcript_87944/g.244032 Transcript_87944/m.244032 type:complete len:202 (+) Transcript_87944:520-1125(+)
MTLSQTWVKIAELRTLWCSYPNLQCSEPGTASVMTLWGAASLSSMLVLDTTEKPSHAKTPMRPRSCSRSRSTSLPNGSVSVKQKNLAKFSLRESVEFLECEASAASGAHAQPASPCGHTSLHSERCSSFLKQRKPLSLQHCVFAQFSLWPEHTPSSSSAFGFSAFSGFPSGVANFSGFSGFSGFSCFTDGLSDFTKSLQFW